ncbi:MAG: glycerol kinase GlpK [Bacteroidetes bacterium]|jgi:glycerol kinase|nr:glycerol kinase GlpK [Bacteroidota bacterium]MBT4410515.1 glycerol kinase GlpK [Bacteroidota bacterium]MBT5424831.1 glycerol kinase GlpK [Bacteroidota bacterium]MBT7464298.1 glycerol kinase GlpK [Bacteroidota bacterium]
MQKYILALDQGTTSSRAIVFDHDGAIKSLAQKEFEQIFPKPGWVEHDPNEIWSSQAAVVAEAISKIGINGKNLAAIGITNQRETTIVWDRISGDPVYNAIVWQDRRTAKTCETLKQNGFENKVKDKTGLVIDAYFSGTKVKWILDHVEGAREKAEKGQLAFGTVDSWLVWKLTQGSRHITDITNASRTMMFNIHTCEWDDELLDMLSIPKSMLPEVVASSEIMAHTKTTLFAHEIPIAGIAGDQQAALFGQQCTQPGMAKNTYGTGCFMLMNTGSKAIKSENNLLTTVAWKIGDQVHYALEGSIFIAGAAVQWLRDQLGLIKTAPEIEELAKTVDDNGGVYFVPALSGLGAPHWDPYARGTVLGITRGSNKGHFARATLEGIAFQVRDVLKSMEADSGIEILELRVDGGAAANNLLMQFQSDCLQAPVIRPKQLETTALGAAYLAGLAVGYWKDMDDLQSQWQKEKQFDQEIKADDMAVMVRKWTRALDKAKSWIDEEDE